MIPRLLYPNLVLFLLQDQNNFLTIVKNSSDFANMLFGNWFVDTERVFSCLDMERTQNYRK